MTKTILIISMILFNWQALAAPTTEQPDRADVDVFYNLENKVGLKGYDPVGYFEEHGAQALKGDSAIITEYGGVIYLFATTENREIFLQDPNKYEPTYGGWCAWAMANEGYFDIDPTLYTQNGNRMHFFVSRGAKFNFDSDLNSRELDADEFWNSETGEKARK